MSGLARTVNKMTPKEDIGTKWLTKKGSSVAGDLNVFKRPDIPTPQEPLMPDTEGLMKARKKAAAAQQGRTGRASTILTNAGGSDRLGG